MSTGVSLALCGFDYYARVSGDLETCLTVRLICVCRIGWKCKVCGMEQPESNSISLCDGERLHCVCLYVTVKITTLSFLVGDDDPYVVSTTL